MVFAAIWCTTFYRKFIDIWTPTWLNNACWEKVGSISFLWEWHRAKRFSRPMELAAMFMLVQRNDGVNSITDWAPTEQVGPRLCRPNLAPSEIESEPPVGPMDPLLARKSTITSTYGGLLLIAVLVHFFVYIETAARMPASRYSFGYVYILPTVNVTAYIILLCDQWPAKLLPTWKRHTSIYPVRARPAKKLSKNCFTFRA